MSAAWKYRRSTSLLFAAVGITLGTLTGLAVAILSTSAGATGLSIVSANSNSSGFIPYAASSSTLQAPSTGPAHDGEGRKYAADADHRSASGVAEAFPLGNVEHSNRSRFIPSRVPTRRKPTRNLAAYREHHPAKLVSHSRVKSTLDLQANAFNAAPVPMNLMVEQLNLDQVARPSNSYIEGDITVVDFDAAAGTIETSDGRTFVVGVTVTASNAASWREFRSNVHYRCSQTGSCSLSRAGAVAPNARLI